MEKKRAVILFADIQGSTRFGYAQDVEPYNEMIRDYHRTVQAAVDKYCQRYGLDRARLACSVKGDECCMFITGGKPGEDEEHALRLAVYLKERWKQSDFVVRIQKAAESGLYPLVDLRVGIGSGEIAWARDCWTGTDTFEGIRISEAKRIEGMADEAKDTLIMVKWEVRDACQGAGLEVEFGGGRRLAGKGIPEGVDIAVYPVTKYLDWAKVQQAVPKAVEKPEWARLLEEALAFAKSGDHEGAIQAYRKALDLRPDLPDAWYNLGVAYDDKGDYDQAMEAYRRALDLRPDDPDAWNGLGVAYAHKGDYDRAMEAFRKALDLRPDDPKVWNNLGVAYRCTKDYDRAMEAYRKALDLRPDYPVAWNSLGVAYRCTKDYDQAMEAYRKALELRPDFPDAWYNLGLASYLKGDSAQALRSYEEADRLKPDPAVQAYSWACLYSLMGKTRGALKHLRRAIELDPQHRSDARTDPDFEPIRDRLAFRRLVGQT